MEQIYTGITTSNNPFITTILAPQLKRRNLPIEYVASIDEILLQSASYLLADTDILPLVKNQQAVAEYFLTGTVGIALTTSHDYKKKLQFLELGFSHCIEIPTATELIIKTIENALKTTRASVLRDAPTVEYVSSQTHFHYLHDQHGNTFLQNGVKAIYMTKIEKSILEYLQKRKGFSALTEIAFAGWKTFDIKPNTIAVTIKKLRKKIEDAKLTYTIRNLYGYGYILEALVR